jgi:hypothetical protein
VNSETSVIVKDAVARLVPSAVLEDQSADELSYVLPGAVDMQLPELFRWIESQKDVLKDWAVSQVTLEDIFIRLTKMSHHVEHAKGAAALATCTQI